MAAWPPAARSGSATRSGSGSETAKVAEKEGKAERMVLVTVRHEVFSPAGLAVEEEQDIVGVALPEAHRLWVPVAAPADPAWSEPVAVDPVLLSPPPH